MKKPKPTNPPKGLKIDIKNPHDSFFKLVISKQENIRDFLKNYLPKDIASKIDYQTVSLLDKELTKKDYKKKYPDLIISAKISGTDTLIYLLLEHKSKKDKFTLIQIISYCISVWETNIRNNEPLKPIIPLVFYHGKDGWDLPQRFEEYFDIPQEFKKYILNFEYALFDTSQYAEEEFLSLGNDYLSLSLIAMKNILLQKEKLINIFRHLSSADASILQDIVDYILFSKRDITLQELQTIAEEGGIKNMPSLGEKLLKIGIEQGFEQGIEQGIERGIEKGIAQGIAEGLQKGIYEGQVKHAKESLLKLLTLRYQITESEKNLIENCFDLSKLNTAIELFATADNKQEILKPLTNN